MGASFAAAACYVLLLHVVIARASTPCPVQLLEVGPPVGSEGKEEESADELRLKETGLQYLAQLTSPLYLVPMLGVYRGGKSMLMNRVMNKVAPYEGGFGVGHGQNTFTRGIYICAEEVRDLGTVVWMDTEGLFSSEEARGDYGPKLFSLALLFSSTVLLNNLKVLNDQFFCFLWRTAAACKSSEERLGGRGLTRGCTAAEQPFNILDLAAASQLRQQGWCQRRSTRQLPGRKGRRKPQSGAQ